MKLTRLLSVTRKELTDGFRDRRALYTILFSTIVGTTACRDDVYEDGGPGEGSAGHPNPRSRTGIRAALSELARTAARGRNHVGARERGGSSARQHNGRCAGDRKDFAEKFRDSRPAPVKVVSDSTRQSTRSKVRRVNGCLASSVR